MSPWAEAIGGPTHRPISVSATGPAIRDWSATRRIHDGLRRPRPSPTGHAPRFRGHQESCLRPGCARRHRGATRRRGPVPDRSDRRPGAPGSPSERGQACCAGCVRAPPAAPARPRPGSNTRRPPFNRNEIGARGAADPIGPGVANQPLVKRLDTGAETLKPMRLGERRGGLEGYAFHGLGAAIRRS
jgi:hypothetical protein